MGTQKVIMKYSVVETIMGIVVIITAILFLIFGFSLEKSNTGKISLYAIFENVSGLSVGDKVKLSGIDIGKITNFELQKDEFEVKIEFDIDKELNIPDDSSALISSASLFGGKFLEIIPGTSEIYLKKNSIIYDTKSSLSFTEMIGKMIMSNGN